MDHEQTKLLGELLPNWPDEWLRAERARLRELRLHALELLAQYHLDRLQFALAIEILLTAIEVDPLRESPHRLLIDVHRREGNYSEAVRRYNDYLVRIRRARLGPSPRLTSLARECGFKDDGIHLAAAESVHLAPSPGSQRTPNAPPTSR